MLKCQSSGRFSCILSVLQLPSLILPITWALYLQLKAFTSSDSLAIYIVVSSGACTFGTLYQECIPVIKSVELLYMYVTAHAKTKLQRTTIESRSDHKSSLHMYQQYRAGVNQT